LNVQPDIVDGSVGGGANTSHTIILPALSSLLDAVPSTASFEDYEHAVVVDNVLGKATECSRKRTFRCLRELYLLRNDAILFRALRDLWPDVPAAQSLLAGLCVLARDSVFRASADAIVGTNPGDVVTSTDLADAVEEHFPDSYSESTLAKIGRNTFSSWEQTGHLHPSEPPEKIRVRAVCRPAAVAYACMLGHLEGVRGEALFDTIWAKALDTPRSHLVDLAAGASQRGLMEFRYAGGVMEVGFRDLLRPIEGQLL
jgi:hypothetical protein